MRQGLLALDMKEDQNIKKSETSPSRGIRIYTPQCASNSKMARIFTTKIREY